MSQSNDDIPINQILLPETVAFFDSSQHSTFSVDCHSNPNSSAKHTRSLPCLRNFHKKCACFNENDLTFRELIIQ